MAAIERASVCTFDCPDACSLRVSVGDDRIVKVRGSDAAPYTAGVICNKVAREMTEFVHGPGRLLHPLRRTRAKGSDSSSGSHGTRRWTKSTSASTRSSAAGVHRR